MKIGLSPLNRIYIGTTKKHKAGEIWTKKEDVTQEAINIVHENLLIQATEDMAINQIESKVGRIIIIPKEMEKKINITIINE